MDVDGDFDVLFADNYCEEIKNMTHLYEPLKPHCSEKMKAIGTWRTILSDFDTKKSDMKYSAMHDATF